MVWFLRGQQRSSVSRVGKGCQLEGALQADGRLQIEGTVRGVVSANGDIEVSETGLVEGSELRGHNISVHGVVKAHVYAEGKLTLGATARIEGNATAGTVDVDPGAYYTGYLATCDSRTPFYGSADRTVAAKRALSSAGPSSLPASSSPVPSSGVKSAQAGR